MKTSSNKHKDQRAMLGISLRLRGQHWSVNRLRDEVTIKLSEMHNNKIKITDGAKGCLVSAQWLTDIVRKDHRRWKSEIREVCWQEMTCIPHGRI